MIDDQTEITIEKSPACALPSRCVHHFAGGRVGAIWPTERSTALARREAPDDRAVGETDGCAEANGGRRSSHGSTSPAAPPERGARPPSACARGQRLARSCGCSHLRAEAFAGLRVTRDRHRRLRLCFPPSGGPRRRDCTPMRSARASRFERHARRCPSAGRLSWARAGPWVHKVEGRWHWTWRPDSPPTPEGGGAGRAELHQERGRGGTRGSTRFATAPIYWLTSIVDNLNYRHYLALMENLRIVPLRADWSSSPACRSPLPVNVGRDTHVLALPREAAYAKVGVVAEVSERVRIGPSARWC